MSHDIRDPLNSIQLATHALREVRGPSGAVKKHVEIVMRGVNRIQHIVGDLLDLSRERGGAGIPLEPRSADLRMTCQQIIQELEPIAAGRKITLDCEADGRGSWDEHRILQAISNLASNAVQHSTPGSPVRLRIAGDERCVAVEVHNQGTIQEDLLPHLFEPFRAAHRHGSRGDGLGLGLFIAKAIARAHGGELEVKSSAGATMFRMLLPRRSP